MGRGVPVPAQPRAIGSPSPDGDAFRVRFRRACGRRARAPGREGRRSGRDDGARDPGAGGVHDHDRCLPRLPRGRAAAGRPRGRGRAAPGASRSRCRKAVRLGGRSAARLGAVGCGGLDAGDDGHDPERRPRRVGGCRAGRADRQRSLRVRLVPAADPDVRGGRRRRRRAPLRERPDHAEARPRRAARHRARRRRSRRAGGDVPADLPRGRRRGVPGRRAGAAPARRRGGVPVVEHAARAGVPEGARDPGRPRHGGQRRADGVREQGRALGHWGRVHARPVDGGTGAVRRVPRERAGRGRGRGDPDAGADRGDARASSGSVCAARRHDGAARAPLPRHAGHRVHGRGRSPLPAPDTVGEADRGSRPEGRGRDGRRGADHARPGGDPHRRRHSSTSSCTR